MLGSGRTSNSIEKEKFFDEPTDMFQPKNDEPADMLEARRIIRTLQMQLSKEKQGRLDLENRINFFNKTIETMSPIHTIDEECDNGNGVKRKVRSRIPLLDLAQKEKQNTKKNASQKGQF
eukprot:Pgem_evm1s11308